MLLKLSPEVEQRFRDVVQDTYLGNTQVAVASMLTLHEKYGWQELLHQDVEDIRIKFRHKRIFTPEAIRRAIARYREGKRST